MPTPGTLRLNFVGRLPLRVTVDVADTGAHGAPYQRIHSGPPASNPLVLQLPQTTGYAVVAAATAFYDPEGDPKSIVEARWPGLTRVAMGYMMPFNRETQGRFQAPPPAATGPRKGGFDGPTPQHAPGAFGLDSLDGTPEGAFGLDSLDDASSSAFGLDTLDGPAFGGAKTDIHARVHPPPGPALAGPLTLRNSTGEVFPIPSPWTSPITISKPSGPGQSRGWMLALFRDGTRIWQMMSPVDLNYGGTADIHVTRRSGKHGGAAFGAVTPTPEQGFAIGMEVLNATLTTIATIAALELQRTGQVSAQTALWQQQLAALQGSTGGGQYLTAEQIAALQGLQLQAQQQQAALTPWYKEPAVMVPLAIVGGVILAAGTAMLVRGRADRLPWDAAGGWQADGWRAAAAAWDY